MAFAGTALSVNFSGTANQIGFDNITLGSEIPTAGTPEPASLALTAAGGFVLAYLRRRRAVSSRA